MAQNGPILHAHHNFVGVRWRPSGRYGAEICHVWLGTFDTAVEAAHAYDAASCYLHRGNVNFPLDDAPISEDVLARLIRAGRVAPAAAAAADVPAAAGPVADVAAPPPQPLEP